MFVFIKTGSAPTLKNIIGKESLAGKCYSFLFVIPGVRLNHLEGFARYIRPRDQIGLDAYPFYFQMRNTLGNTVNGCQNYMINTCYGSFSFSFGMDLMALLRLR